MAIRFSILLMILIVISAPALADSTLYLGGNKNTGAQGAPTLFLKRGTNPSSSTPLVFNTNRDRGAGGTTYYGTASRPASSGSSYDDQMAALSEQNRRADYDIMMQQSQETQAKIAANQAARDARRAQEAQQELASDNSVANNVSARSQSSTSRMIYVQPSGLQTPKKVFNSY